MIDNNIVYLRSIDLLKLIPHRYPFVLIDQAIFYKKKNYIKSIKNITVNDPWIQGHFPNYFIFPSVLMIECIAQTAIILLMLNGNKLNKYNEGHYHILGIDNARFKHPAFPGDRLIIKVSVLKERNEIIFFKGIIYSKNKIICRTKIICKYIVNK